MSFPVSWYHVLGFLWGPQCPPAERDSRGVDLVCILCRYDVKDTWARPYYVELLWPRPHIAGVRCKNDSVLNYPEFVSSSQHSLLDSPVFLASAQWGGWGREVSCGGHHRLRGKTTTGSALDGAVFDIAQILAYLVHTMSRSQLYLGFGHFGWLGWIGFV